MAQTHSTVDDVKQSFKIKLFRYICVLIVLGVAILFLYFNITQNNYTLYDTILSDNLPSVILVFFALILIFIRALTSPAGANSRKAYWGLTLAVLFYFLGEATFALLAMFVYGPDVPYPGLGDVFWVIGTIFFIDELFFMISVIKVKFTKKQLTTIYGITAIVVVGLILFVFGSIITETYDLSAGITPFSKATDLFYFTGDVLILFATIYIVFGLFAKTGFRLSPKHLSWIFLILGNISMIIGDAVFAYWTETGYSSNLVIHLGSFFTLTYFASITINGTVYYSYTIDNLLYMLQYLFWALSFAFFPAFLNRSFAQPTSSQGQDINDEFTPIEPQKHTSHEQTTEAATENVDNIAKVGEVEKVEIIDKGGGVQKAENFTYEGGLQKVENLASSELTNKKLSANEEENQENK